MSPPDRSPLLIIWTLVVVATLALFGLLSWQAFSARGGPAAVAPTPLPADASTPTATAVPPTPTRTPTRTPTPENGDVGSAGAEPSAQLTADVEAIVAAVLTRMPRATPTPTPDRAATATAQAALVTTAVGEVRPAAVDDDALALWISAVSAITALLGLATSAIFGWRKEVREAKLAQLELEKTRLEVERLRRELEGIHHPTTHSADAR